MRGLVRRLTAALSVSALFAMTGCAGFWVYPGTASSSTGTGSTTGDYVYVANSTSLSISGFAVGSTGTLSPVTGSPVSLGVAPEAMVVNHANSILFVASSSAIYAYSISSSGSLTALSSGGATGFSNIVSMDVSPDGQWLFVLDDNSSAPSLDEYSINSSTGALANPKVSLFASASPVSPQAVKVSPNGAYVFVALGTAGDMVFPLTTSTGALGTALPLTGSATVSDNALTVDPTSTYLYIARSSGTTGSVVAYSIGTGGALTLVNSYPAGDDPYSVGMNTTGTYLYVANLLDSTISISGYSVATNGGALTSLGTAYSGGSGVNGLAADKSGDYVLAINSGGSPGLSMYSYDSTTPGTLDPAASATTGTGTKAIAVTH